MKVKTIKYNWHQEGSVQGEHGSGEDYDWFTVGEKGVKEIIEFNPQFPNQVWNYLVHLDNGTTYRIFNPNFVEYFKS